MIQLGLSRAARLWKNAPQPWKAIHVAGTNGKGSTCAYLSSIFYQLGWKTGRYMSPHLIDRWDCITIDERPVSKALFDDVHERVIARNKAEGIEATPFELLTVTAFEIFTQEQVQLAVVETGMGGREDATNILQHKLASVITQISLDHQSFLGDTVEEIATHKAGIIAPSTPVIYDKRNDVSVQEVITKEAKDKVAPAIACQSFMRMRTKAVEPIGWKRWLDAEGRYSGGKRNLALAYSTLLHLQNVLPNRHPEPMLWLRRCLAGFMQTPTLPARSETVDIAPLLGLDAPSQLAFLDGAHNINAATLITTRIRNYVRRAHYNKRIVEGFMPVCWLIAHTKGRPISPFLHELVWPGDSVAAVEFGPVDGMPWVESQPSEEILEALQQTELKARVHIQTDEKRGIFDEQGPEETSTGLPEENIKSFGRDLPSALAWATSRTSTHVNNTPVPLVITGSLYLCSDILRLLRSKGAWDYPPPFLPNSTLRTGRGSQVTPTEIKEMDEKIDELRRAFQDKLDRREKMVRLAEGKKERERVKEVERRRRTELPRRSAKFGALEQLSRPELLKVPVGWGRKTDE